MKRKYDLYLWLPEAAISAALQRELETVWSAENTLRLLPLEKRREFLQGDLQAADSVHLLGMATDMKVMTVCKGHLRFRLRTREKTDVQRVYEALWPAHPLYHVTPDTPPDLRNTFLPGMTTYHCRNDEAGMLVEAFTVPGDTEESIRREILRKLAEAELPAEELSACGETQEPFRTSLDGALLDALVKASMSLYGKGPNFEWCQGESPLREIGAVYHNTFALGSGKTAEPMRVSQRENQEKTETFQCDEAFVGFVKAFIRQMI